MVIGLLEAGARVTVIARTCALAPREGLRFIRVRTPRRPATIALPAFFLAAAPLVARHRGALVHSTGAIVPNRVDVSTVHYCHRAAAARVQAPRASSSGLFYRLNAAIAARLSRAAERWCYRPSRTRVLCAVSDGVAAELRLHFPGAAASVRTVPNGVDASTFRPDPPARARLRAQLGLGDADRLALFVGGDWERKGLRHAVDALAHAPGWHLAVAGAGDRSGPSTRAHNAGTSERLHFLGAVREMPPVYAAADSFVFPTAYEAFPLVALEAAASGLPIIATRVNGVEQLVEDGANGWFVGRDGREIGRRLRELAADDTLARKMAAEARAAAAGFSWQAMTHGYLDVYAQVSSGA
jgi:glycosyltransferase involved in cell wall biosynthesis